MSVISKINRRDAVADPQRAFDTPASLVAEPGLTAAEKLTALKRWAFDVNQRLSAGNEGMPTVGRATDDAELLMDIGRAQLEIEQRIRSEKRS